MHDSTCGGVDQDPTVIVLYVYFRVITPPPVLLCCLGVECVTPLLRYSAILYSTTCDRKLYVEAMLEQTFFTGLYLQACNACFRIAAVLAYLSQCLLSPDITCLALLVELASSTCHSRNPGSKLTERETLGT